MKRHQARPGPQQILGYGLERFSFYSHHAPVYANTVNTPNDLARHFDRKRDGTRRGYMYQFAKLHMHRTDDHSLPAEL